ncbi:MAG TPA: ORF6N domain-containing protein [Verrucomicrobiae bacterium]|jgi:hypothetical protein
MAARAQIIPLERIERVILLFRGQKVLLDSDLAALYGVEIKVLNQAVKRNASRFPRDFCFQLTTQEHASLRSLRSQSVTLKRGSHRKFRPYVFTEQGVAMLSSVLRSPRAVQVNIGIVRAFVRLRQLLASNFELAHRLDALEKKYDSHFKAVFEAIRQLMDAPANDKESREIGFHTLQEGEDAAAPPRRPRRVRY